MYWDSKKMMGNGHLLQLRPCLFHRYLFMVKNGADDSMRLRREKIATQVINGFGFVQEIGTFKQTGQDLRGDTVLMH